MILLVSKNVFYLTVTAYVVKNIQNWNRGTNGWLTLLDITGLSLGHYSLLLIVITNSHYLHRNTDADNKKIQPVHPVVK